MNYVKVMISEFYKGGIWEDEGTGVIFDPKKDHGKVFVIPTSRDLTGIKASLMNQHLVPVDGYSQAEMEEFANAGLAQEPVVVDVMGRKMSLEVSFDRPVYPIPGKTLTVPTPSGVQTLQATDAFMENLATAVYQVNANGPIQIEAGAFIDDYKLFSKAYGKPTTVPVTGVSIAPTSINPTEGDKGVFTATVAPSDATDKTVTFSSSNAAIITVDNAGNWTAVKEGTATITATASGKTATANVAVKAKVIPVTGVTASPKTVSGKPGDKAKITATVAPSTATNKAITWTSSDATVATITNTGDYTLVKDGTATFTVKTTDGNKQDTVAVTVATPAEPEATVQASAVPKKRATRKKADAE